MSKQITKEQLKKAQQAILCNQKDASMNEDYIIDFLNSLTKPKEYEFVVKEPFEIKDNKVLGNWITK